MVLEFLSISLQKELGEMATAVVVFSELEFIAIVFPNQYALFVEAVGLSQVGISG